MWVVVMAKNRLKDFPKCLFRLCGWGDKLVPKTQFRPLLPKPFLHPPRPGADRCFLHVLSPEAGRCWAPVTFY